MLSASLERWAPCTGQVTATRLTRLYNRLAITELIAKVNSSATEVCRFASSRNRTGVRHHNLQGLDA